MGDNSFISLSAIPANTQPNAVLPAVDLWALVPPTGLDPGFTVICSGDFEGTIVLDGSLDGVGFSPVASFTVTRQVARNVAPPVTPSRKTVDVYPDSGAYSGIAHGTGSSLPAQPDVLFAIELGPVVVDEVVRFVQLRVASGTKVLTDVKVTLGGPANCNCPSGGGGGGSGALRFVESVESVGTTLVTLTTVGFQDGARVFVGNTTFAGRGSVHDYFHIETSTTLTAIEGEQYPSPDEANRWYVREHVPSARFLDSTAAAFWSVTCDGALGTGIIDNDGFSSVSMVAASANPISMRELNRRGAGMSSRPLETTVQIRQNDAMTLPARTELEAITMTNWYGPNELAYPMWRGNKGTPFFSGVVTAYAAANPAGNTGFLLSIVGVGTAIGIGTGSGFLVQNAAGTKSAFTTVGLSANQVRVTQPNNGDPVSGFTGTEVSFTVGETVNLFILPGMPVYPWAADQFMFPEVDGVNFCTSNGEGITDFFQGFLGDTSTFIFQTIFTGGVWAGGPDMANNVFSTVWFAGGVTVQAPMSLHFSGAGPSTITTGEIRTLNTTVTVDDNTFTWENSSVLCRTARWNWTSGGVNAAFFNVPDGLHNQAMVRVDEGGGWDRESGFIYGTGNTARIFRVAALCELNERRSGIVVVTTFTHPIFVENGEPSIDYDVAAISIRADGTGAAIFDPNFPTVAGTLKFTGTVVTSVAGTVTSFAADAGSLLSAANQTTPQLYPTSKRRAARLRVTKTVAPAGSLADVTVTLRKNGVATALTVTILAADAAGTTYTFAQPAGSVSPEYADGDTFDLVATAPAETGTEGIVGYSATVDT